VSQPTRAEFQRLLASGELFERYAQMVEGIAAVEQGLTALVGAWNEGTVGMDATVARTLDAYAARLTRLQQGAD
jgi:hypothetical protein